MKAISDFLVECGWYALPMSLVFLALTLPFLFLKARRRIAAFSACLFLTSTLSGALWSAFVWNKRYHSTDYLFDFSPFWPITQRVIEAEFAGRKGYLIDTTLSQLNLIWFAYASGSWISAYLLYRFICGRCKALKIPQSLSNKSPMRSGAWRRTLQKMMKTSRDSIVADGHSRIRESEAFSRRREEIIQNMIQSRQGEIDSAGWLHRRLITWGIQRAALKQAQAELCPPEALYLKGK